MHQNFFVKNYIKKKFLEKYISDNLKKFLFKIKKSRCILNSGN